MKCKQFVAAIAGLTALSSVWSGSAYADPSQDAVAKLNELTKQAQQLIENVQSAQADLDKKLLLQKEVDQKHADASVSSHVKCCLPRRTPTLRRS